MTRHVRGRTVTCRGLALTAKLGVRDPLKGGRRKVLFNAWEPCGWSECAHIQNVPSLTGIHGMRELRGGRNPRPFSPSLNRKQLPFVNISRMRHCTLRLTHSTKAGLCYPSDRRNGLREQQYPPGTTHLGGAGGESGPEPTPPPPAHCYKGAQNLSHYTLAQ